ncbi:head GIN domain-containing protein [Pontibacter fetidus]|uniref:DUF2807 domain-containing protein n=1 Tax=Pontibacter fetidus TaxID=2700082 RepID=A0A6B2H2I9_9BACT|nr:head GIN domain-containing protein [Pontibacter fetidus]NDK54836.1 DUF2807 domain-containing protein [Pontibacter fetidus]
MRNITSSTAAIVFLLLLAILGLGGDAWAQQIKGNGNLQTQTRKVSDFSGIKVSGGFTIEIKQGKQEELKIEAEENLMNNIRSEVKNGMLYLYTEGSINTRKGIKAYVTVDQLNALKISGGVKVVGLSTFKAETFEMDLSGGTNVSLALDVKKLDADMSGASKVTLTGRADEVELDMAGASNIDTHELKAKAVKVSASGASKVKVFASETLTIDANGPSTIAYAGSPKIQAETSTLSKISKL